MTATVLDRARRAAVQEYFDRTAADNWARLTSAAPVGRIRSSVRAGRDRTRARLLAWLPERLGGTRVLDAGCGTGQLAMELAGRGAAVTAVDLSPTLIGLARQRSGDEMPATPIDFRVGDMLDPGLGRFDYVAAMDSLIHYEADDAISALAALAPRVEHAILFTFAPRTPMLGALHAVGRWFPRSQRAPAIVPLAEQAFHRRLMVQPALRHWRLAWTGRISTLFYRSQLVVLIRERS
jgi:magnesium-protoporphyrin O-methyltransferase